MFLCVNGEQKDVTEPITILGLLQHLGLAETRVAVEVNQEVVPRAVHGAHALRSGDVVEIVHFVGGG